MLVYSSDPHADEVTHLISGAEVKLLELWDTAE